MRIGPFWAACLVSLIALTASAQAAPPINPESRLYKAFENFISGAYLQDWFADPARIQRHYPDRMSNYWGRRGVPLRAVLSDKLAYARRWPDRSFQLVSDTLVVVPTRQPDTYDLRFNYEYDVRADGRRSAGVGVTELTVTLRGERVTILSESGRVLRRY